MCDQVTERNSNNSYNEDYGNILAQHDEVKTNEKEKEAYDEKMKVW